MSEPWRLRCPRGHCTWTRRGDRYYCERCDRKYDNLIDVKEDDAEVTPLPDPPFSAGVPRDNDAYHTHRCGTVKAQDVDGRIRHLSENEIEYHDLTHCEHCRELALPDRFIVGHNGSVYHTRDCCAVRNIEDVVAVGDFAIDESELSLCSWCSDDAQPLQNDDVPAREVVADD
jgi:hypothetical protein